MDRSPDFDAWLLRRAKEKPQNPIYAHLQARVALGLVEEENGAGRGVFVSSSPLPVVADNKSRAAGEEKEEESEVWDSIEPIEGEDNGMQ